MIYILVNEPFVHYCDAVKMILIHESITYSTWKQSRDPEVQRTSVFVVMRWAEGQTQMKLWFVSIKSVITTFGFSQWRPEDKPASVFRHPNNHFIQNGSTGADQPQDFFNRHLSDKLMLMWSVERVREIWVGYGLNPVNSQNNWHHMTTRKLSCCSKSSTTVKLPKGDIIVRIQ